MKHVKKHVQYNKKDIIKKGFTMLIFVVFAIIMIVQKDVPTTEVQFVRNSNEVITHSAANQERDYLFQNESGTNLYQGQIATGTITWATIDVLINPNEAEQILANLETGILATWMIYTAPLDCITPWWDQVKHQDFILGYQQRKDVNSMCNIEKRICKNGVLGGTFSQSSCKEDMVYTYRNAEVVSYNQKVLNEFIQPPAPINEGAEFNTQWKINETTRPIDTRGTTNTPVRIIRSWSQTIIPEKLSCRTPRGQIIQNGQFIKAYKSARGFINLGCDVEIRACVDGQLKGKYIYPKCKFYNTTYADYLEEGSPTSNTGFLFFERIKSTLGR